MALKKWVRLVFATGGIVVAGLSASYAWFYYKMWNKPVGNESGWCIEITPDEARSDTWMDDYTEIANIIQWRRWSAYAGRYCEDGIASAHQIARRIATGQREEVAVTVPAKRSIEELAAAIAPKLHADSASIVQMLRPDTIQWRIIPNTYNMYWESDAAELKERLLAESRKWWNRKRIERAWELGLSQKEVVTLASIVQEETANKSEAKTVAGLYLNRLNRGMLLQADPTLKFALGDWSIQRLLDKDKKITSAYNTYRNPGLPPGPIRIPDTYYIDAVLFAESHNYLYMCAKPDGSGTHAFARRYSQHLKNARAWQNMLNRERIYR
tara:strand:- start:3404 stop:4381 length:978 start_codon:yes stop_codon:yes gene_type:complete